MFKLLKTSVQGAKKKEIPSRINTIKTTPGLSLVKILLMTYKANIPKAPSKNDRREVEKKKSRDPQGKSDITVSFFKIL